MINNAKNTFNVAKAINLDIQNEIGSPEEGFLADTHLVVPRSLVRGTRGYIEKISNQANGSYENGWYDSSAVMIRRLIETLIIETYEKFSIENKIKNSEGDFVYLRDLINRCLSETAWSLSRNCKKALPKLKDLGDKSAHSRRYIAIKSDLEPLLPDIRLVVQEFIYLAGLK